MGIISSKESFNSNNGQIRGIFHYKVMTNGSGNVYKYTIQIDLNDDRENIVQSLNEQIDVITPQLEEEMETIGDDNIANNITDNDYRRKGYFRTKETDKIVFVLPENASEVTFEDNENINSEPSIFPFLGISPDTYNVRDTPELEIQLSTNKDITLLKYNEESVRNKLDKLRYGSDYRNFNKILEIKEKLTNITTNNVKSLEYKEAWYMKALYYFKIILRILVLIVLVNYLINEKYKNYSVIIAIVLFWIYSLF